MRKFICSSKETRRITIFSRLDATSGCWNIPLDKKSADYCTFGTPFGRSKFLRLSFGIKTASEVFQEYFKEIFAIPDVEFHIDDILVHGKTKKEHDGCLEKVFQCSK